MERHCPMLWWYSSRLMWAPAAQTPGRANASIFQSPRVVCERNFWEECAAHCLYTGGGRRQNLICVLLHFKGSSTPQRWPSEGSLVLDPAPCSALKFPSHFPPPPHIGPGVWLTLHHTGQSSPWKRRKEKKKHSSIRDLWKMNKGITLVSDIDMF